MNSEAPVWAQKKGRPSKSRYGPLKEKRDNARAVWTNHHKKCPRCNRGDWIRPEKSLLCETGKELIGKWILANHEAERFQNK